MEQKKEGVDVASDFLIQNGVLRRYAGAGGAVRIPDGVVKIAPRAFLQCYGLEEVVLPASLREIGQQAFAGCRGLKKVTIPAEVLVFGEDIFQWCRGQGDPAELALFIRALSEFTGVPHPLPPQESPFDDWVLTVYTPEGSGAEFYAREYGIPVVCFFENKFDLEKYFV